jgi:hypothetical protein
LVEAGHLTACHFAEAMLADGWSAA